MTDSELRDRVHELCGWQRAKPGRMMPYQWAPGHISEIEIKWTRGKLSKGGSGQEVCAEAPDYCGDLNAMHEAEKTLKPEQTVLYGHHLSNGSDSYRVSIDAVAMSGCVFRACVSATARQRALAFVATLTK